MSDINAQYAAYQDFLNRVAAQQKLDPTRGIFGEDMTVPQPPVEDVGKIRAANEFNQGAKGYKDFLSQVAFNERGASPTREPMDPGGAAVPPGGSLGAAAGMDAGRAGPNTAAEYEVPGVRNGVFQPGGLKFSRTR